MIGAYDQYFDANIGKRVTSRYLLVNITNRVGYTAEGRMPHQSVQIVEN